MKSKIVGLIFAAIFALGFGISGIFYAFIPLIHNLYDIWQARTFIPIPATVVEVKLQNGFEGTIKVSARYRYTFKNQDYESTRIGIFGTGSDNIGSWHSDWYARLEESRRDHLSIIAWVNPIEPQEAWLDREFRWPKLFFMLPFAILFPAIGLGALWIFVTILRTPPEPPAPIMTSTIKIESAVLKDDTRAQARGLWIFSSFWNLLSWPFALMVWSSQKNWWEILFISLFPLVGLLLLRLAISATLKVKRVDGTEVGIQPKLPRVGQTLDITIRLPARRLTESRQFEVHLVESCIQDSSSSPTPREVWSERQQQTVLMQADGNGLIQTAFSIPANRSATDKVIDGYRTVWTLNLIELANFDVQNFELTVLPGVPNATQYVPATGHDRPTAVDAWTTAGEATPFVTHVSEKIMRVVERNGQWTAHFSMRLSRWLGLLWIFPTSGAFLLARQNFLGNASIDVIFSLLCILAGCIGIAIFVHQVSKSWRLIIDQYGTVVERDSWLGYRTVVLSRDDAMNLQKKCMFQMQNGGGYQNYFGIYALARNGMHVQITPSIALESVTDSVAHAIRTAQMNYAQLFTPLDRQPKPANTNRMVGWLLFLAIAFTYVSAVSLNSTFRLGDPINLSRIARDWAMRLDRLTPTAWNFEKFVEAQDHSDLAVLETLLKQGANPNTVANNGSTFLMMAARRDELAHVELLLRYGADVNQRDETSNNNRGDSALLVALHGGHEKVVLKLLEAGARLDVSNMWDWTPMHMAAQGNCIPCLDLLQQKGVPINTPAPASRGETPAMLAAARGNLEALQWFVSKGIDLHEKDAYGNSALDWAIFGKKENTTRWIKENM